MTDSTTQLAYVREHYHVPAWPGARVRVDGYAGVIVGGRDAEIRVREAHLRAERDVAYDVIRRLRDGWELMPFVGDEVRWCREGPTEDRPDLLRSWEPMTDAERAVLDVLADTNDTEENR